jgi:hypothetical protein
LLSILPYYPFLQSFTGREPQILLSTILSSYHSCLTILNLPPGYLGSFHINIFGDLYHQTFKFVKNPKTSNPQMDSAIVLGAIWFF